VAADLIRRHYAMSNPRGFTLIELMIVIVIIGILAAISIPSAIQMVGRAKEGATKANMHTVQVAAEDYAITSGGFYANTMDATHIADLLPGGFMNPFDQTKGANNAWEYRASTTADPTGRPGITSYADSASANTYNVKGYGRLAPIAIVMSSGL